MAIEIHLPPGARSAPPAAVTSTSNLHRSRASQTRKPQTTPLESPARPQWSRDDDPLPVGLISLSVRCRARRHLARPGLLENGQEISWVRQPSVVVSRLAACHCVPNASQARRERALVTRIGTAFPFRTESIFNFYRKLSIFLRGFFFPSRVNVPMRYDDAISWYFVERFVSRAEERLQKML